MGTGSDEGTAAEVADRSAPTPTAPVATDAPGPGWGAARTPVAAATDAPDADPSAAVVLDDSIDRSIDRSIAGRITGHPAVASRHLLDDWRTATDGPIDPVRATTPAADGQPSCPGPARP